MAYCAHCGSYVAQVSYTPCASCGNPTNGAPPRPLPSGGTNVAAIVIGVVVGVLVIVAVIGILAAIAVPNLLTAMQRSKQKRTMADMRSIGTAVESYRVDNDDKVPPSTSELAPKYLKAVPAVDGWGTPLRYETTTAGYTIASAGADKQFEDAPAGGVTSSFDCDLIFSNGQFLQYPGGPAFGGGH